MEKSKRSLADSLRELSRSEGPHPDRADLLGLVVGDLDESEAVQIREHLAGCLACQRSMQGLLDTCGSETGGEEDQVDSREELEKAWLAVRERMADEVPGGGGGG